MGGRSERITVYVTEERKAELEQRADEQDESVSGLINECIDRRFQQEAQEAIASEVRAEERIQELMTLGKEELVETAKEIRDMNAKFGTYAIANFELMKQEHTDYARKEALRTGARRLRQDLDAVAADLSEELDDSDPELPTSSETDATATESEQAATEASTSPETDAGGSATETAGADGSVAEDGPQREGEAESSLFDDLRSDRQ